jgi:hypothetical protein
MKKDKNWSIIVKRARHMPKYEDKEILNIYSRIDKNL